MVTPDIADLESRVILVRVFLATLVILVNQVILDILVSADIVDILARVFRDTLVRAFPDILVIPEYQDIPDIQDTLESVDILVQEFQVIAGLVCQDTRVTLESVVILDIAVTVGSRDIQDTVVTQDPASPVIQATREFLDTAVIAEDLDIAVSLEIFMQPHHLIQLTSVQ